MTYQENDVRAVSGIVENNRGEYYFIIYYVSKRNHNGIRLPEHQTHYFLNEFQAICTHAAVLTRVGTKPKKPLWPQAS